MNLYFHGFRTATFSRGKDFMPVGRWGSDMPAKMAENLHTDWLAIFRNRVIPFSEGGIAGEITRTIMVDIAENIVP